MRTLISVILNLFQDLLPAGRPVNKQGRCRNKFGMTKKVENGFTLVELLTAIIVLVAVGSVITGLIASSLRGTNKTNTIENIRQNGNYALAQMVKDIGYAQIFDGTSTGFVTIVDNVKSYQTACPVSLTDIAIRSTASDSVVVEYVCNGSTLTASKNNGTPISLIDSSVSLSGCSFTCTQTNTTPPIIGISFTLAPNTTSSLVEKNATPITFETSVSMRNYRN